jgi:RNA ligase (TIGR02306 family)
MGFERMKTARKLASIKQITHIKPIPEADLIECVIVDGGWPVVVKKGEYQVGDIAIYLEIDSWVPHEIAPFLSKGKEPSEYNGVKGERLKTIKLKRQISQGLLLPIELTSYRDIGTDLTEVLNIQKWEAPIPTQLQGTAKGMFPTHIIPKTDQERCQNLVNEIFSLHKGETYEVTIKLDGSSMTVYYHNGDIGVCSRNLDLLESETNTFWKVARQNKIIDSLTEYCKNKNRNLALQGELIGEGIQGNPENLKGQQFYIFDIFDIDNQRYLKPHERYELTTELSHIVGTVIEHVPVIEKQITTEAFNDVNGILEAAEGNSLNKTKREGIVFKSHDSDFSFKAISNSYLLKSK